MTSAIAGCMESKQRKQWRNVILEKTMGRKVLSPSDRKRIIQILKRGEVSKSQLCIRFEISRTQLRNILRDAKEAGEAAAGGAPPLDRRSRAALNPTEPTR